jgi:hypothetical protein
MRTNILERRAVTSSRKASLAALIAIVTSALGMSGLGADNSGIHWVSPTGSVSWANCESAAPLSGVSACAMATANQNAAAGDTIVIRGGVYNTNIQPARSGSATNRITYRGYDGETVRISDAGTAAGIELNGVDYVTITNVTVRDTYQLVNIRNGSDYNEISHCTLSHGTGPMNSGVNILTNRVTTLTKNTHNWIHHCTIYGAGFINAACDDAGGLISIGGDNTLDGLSDHNTIEDNEIYWGAHHALRVNTRFNVVRNNFIHNEGYFAASAACQLQACTPDGLYGNRVLTVLNNHVDRAAWFSDTYNLIEGNRIGSAGLAADGNGADALTLGGERDIARYNTIFDAQEQGIYFRSPGNIADHNRVYNNTVAYNGQGPQCRIDAYPGFSKGGVRLPAGANNNVLKNNLLFGNSGIEVENSGAGNVLTGNWLAANGNPLFVDSRLGHPPTATAPNLFLRAGSGAIDNGVALTLADGAGISATQLVVDDALYFQDGSRGSALSSIQADWIAIGSVSNIVQITRVNYATNTITLASPKTWSNRARIWLAQDSDGTVVLEGAGPDQGAHEFTIRPGAPSSLRIIPQSP